MNATESEQLIRLSDAVSLPWLPRKDGKAMTVQTIYRWTTRGVRGRRLRTVQVGGCRCVTEGMLREFFASLGGEQEVGAQPPATRSPAKRQRDHDRAMRELAAVGI